MGAKNVVVISNVFPHGTSEQFLTFREGREDEPNATINQFVTEV